MLWQRWVRQPQNIWFRRALFQVHLWTGIGIGLYILMISLTGSVLVYRNELYTAVTPQLIVSTGTGPRLTDDQLTAAAMRLYPGYRVENLGRARVLDQAVDVWLRRGGKIKKRLFDPRTGSDLGESVPTGLWLVSSLLDLHDNLLAGETGRQVNGVGALAVLALAATGLVIWWPGIKTWRRSLTVDRGLGWKRLIWHLHSMIGLWSLGFITVFAVSGIYLGIPQPFQDLADQLEPLTPANAGTRIGDEVIYWLAYLHFGRINGIGIPCSGPGLCDQTTKAVWAVFGLAPAAMFLTGAIMWWNRVLGPRWQSFAIREQYTKGTKENHKRHKKKFFFVLFVLLLLRLLWSGSRFLVQSPSGAYANSYHGNCVPSLERLIPSTSVGIQFPVATLTP